MHFGPLVDNDWLQANIERPDVRVIDTRWYFDGRSGVEAYRAGHIRGAAYVPLEYDLSGTEGEGRHPLPEAAAFERAMRRAGVGRASQVVVYDDAGGSIAARLWWLFRFFGRPQAAVLDGGLQAWTEELTAGDENPAPGDFETGPPDWTMFVRRAEVPGLDVPLLDARAPERYRGEIEPFDPIAGHIPGALNAFWKDNLDESGRFRSPAELRARFSALGLIPGGGVVGYCGSGVTTCHNLLALDLAGFGQTQMYGGSWSDWSSQPEPTVATGPRP